ncbi:MAG TPA: hypothetical protein ENN08_06965, partial [Bacteroidales bacterium]|nr:hypothetical protein [Bacteroidales bacterium]
MDPLKDNAQQPDEESIDFKMLFFRIFSYWYFFLITIFIALLISFLYNKYAVPVYRVKTTILIKDDKSRMDPQALLGISMMGTSQNLQNEIGILKSYSLANRAVKELNLNVSYFIEENFMIRELYHTSPFVVVPQISQPQPANFKFLISVLSNNEFRLEAEGENIDLYDFGQFRSIEKGAKKIQINGIFNFGQAIEGEYYNFKILLNEDFLDTDIRNKKYLFIFNDLDGLSRELRNSIEIEPINRESSILEVAIKGNNIKKSTDFLNTLIEVYLTRSLDKKNLVATNTIDFIDSQLGEIADSLNLA